jgi:hypothetical protein
MGCVDNENLGWSGVEEQQQRPVSRRVFSDLWGGLWEDEKVEVEECVESFENWGGMSCDGLC